MSDPIVYFVFHHYFLILLGLAGCIAWNFGISRSIEANSSWENLSGILMALLAAAMLIDFFLRVIQL